MYVRIYVCMYVGMYANMVFVMMMHLTFSRILIVGKITRLCFVDTSQLKLLVATHQGTVLYLLAL